MAKLTELIANSDYRIVVGCMGCGETGLIPIGILQISGTPAGLKISNLPICSRCGITMQPEPEVTTLISRVGFPSLPLAT